MKTLLRRAAVTCGILIILYTVLRVVFPQRTMGMRPRLLLASWVLIFVSILIHEEKAGGRINRPYLRSLVLGGFDRPGRIAWLDYVRVLATMLVIVVHMVPALVQNLPAGNFVRGLAIQTENAGLVCNQLFVMVSGALLLGTGKEPASLFSFYRKRFLRVFIPCGLYFLLYYAYIYGAGFLSPANWRLLSQCFITLQDGTTPHFWLMHAIIVFYLAAPLYMPALRRMSGEELDRLALVILLLHTLFTYSYLIGIKFQFVSFLAQWDSVFLLGYYLSTDRALRHQKKFFAAGLISLLIMMVVRRTREDYLFLIYNNATLMILWASAIFLFIKKHAGDWFSKEGKLLYALGKVSFSVLLVHWLVLYRIVGDILGINAMSFGIIGGVPATFILTLAISAGIALVFDNTVVLCATEVCEKCFDFLGNVFARAAAGGADAATAVQPAMQDGAGTASSVDQSRQQDGAGTASSAVHRGQQDAPAAAAGNRGNLPAILILTSGIFLLGMVTGKAKSAGEVGAVLLMMSTGYILFSGTEDLSWKETYLRAFTRILLPMFLAYLVLSALFFGTERLIPANWWGNVTNFFAGPYAANPPYWPPLVLCGVLLSAPFLIRIFRGMPFRMQDETALAVIVLHAVFTYMPLLGYQFLMPTFLAGWESLLFLGYYGAGEGAARHEKVILAAGAAGLFAMLYLHMRWPELPVLIYNNAPPAVLVGLALTVLLRKLCGKIAGEPSAILRGAARISYPVLLALWLFTAARG